MFVWRRKVALGLIVLVAALSIALGSPAWGSNGNGLKGVKGGKKGKKVGRGDLLIDDIDADDFSPMDCAKYLCPLYPDKSASYIESGCPGQFVDFTPTKTQLESLGSLAEITSETYTSGVSTGTLLSLACASGVFAVGVGFLAGYKASPSFAYTRIPPGS